MSRALSASDSSRPWEVAQTQPYTDEERAFIESIPMIKMERKTEYVATETHRYTFRCSCGYLSDPLVNLHDAQQVLKMHQDHEGSQELTVYAVGQPSYR